MTTYGLTSTGFVPKTIEVIREEVNAELRSRFGTSIPLGDGEILGQVVGILAEREALLWELAEAVYNMMDPDAATDAALEALCALTGTIRRAATSSLVTMTLTGNAATLVPTGSRAKTSSTGIPFETTADATLAALTLWAPSTAYVVGDRRANATKCYICITAGTSAGSGGPTTTAADITDGTVHWKYLGNGLAAADAAGQSVDTGPQVAVAGDLTVIDTAVSGWQGVTNLLDATLGQNIETNEELRIRRVQELSLPGTSPVNAIREDLLDLDDVTAVRIFENNTDATDSDGMPPHSVEALVQGGTNQDIFDQLLDSVAGGIATYGNTSGTAVDDEGVSHTMKFSRPVEIPIYVIITIVKDATLYPADGDAQVKLAITQGPYVGICGRDARSKHIGAQAFEVPGVLDVTTCYIGIAPGPASEATIAVALRQLATYDTSRITVNSSSGTP